MCVQHTNPLCRVTPVKDAKKADEEILRYDKEKYRDMILDGAQ
ncbi:MAG TPA: hypothetical protein VE445_00450 [Nitrososphaeraceae archaeon]|jgi:hypothetical protein|nr:hypothetical protein [Nitrososphaeraceae archaeon]